MSSETDLQRLKKLSLEINILFKDKEVDENLATMKSILHTAVVPSRSKSSMLFPGQSQGSNSFSVTCPLNLLIAVSV